MSDDFPVLNFSRQPGLRVNTIRMKSSTIRLKGGVINLEKNL
jgi:hypothetical protein